MRLLTSGPVARILDGVATWEGRKPADLRITARGLKGLRIHSTPATRDDALIAQDRPDEPTHHSMIPHPGSGG
jgi:hypothetical protein